MPTKDGLFSNDEFMTRFMGERFRSQMDRFIGQPMTTTALATVRAQAEAQGYRVNSISTNGNTVTLDVEVDPFVELMRKEDQRFLDLLRVGTLTVNDLEIEDVPQENPLDHLELL